MQQHMMLYILLLLTVVVAFISEANIEQIPETPNALYTYCLSCVITWLVRNGSLHL